MFFQFDFLNCIGSFSILNSMNRNSVLLLIPSFSLFLLFIFLIPPILPSYIRQDWQAKNDKIRIISAFSNVNYEEQENKYEMNGKISQDFLENSNINLKEVG